MTDYACPGTDCPLRHKCWRYLRPDREKLYQQVPWYVRDGGMGTIDCDNLIRVVDTK